MTLITRIFRVLIVLLISLTITGNTTENNSASSDPFIGASSAEMNQMLSNSSNNLNAYRFMLDSIQKIALINQSANINSTSRIVINSSSEGAVNLTGRSMRISSILSVNSDGSKNTTSPSSSETYFLNDTIYMRMDKNWTQIGMSSPQELWNHEHMIRHQIELLNRSKLEISGSENIDGQDCFKVNVTPDLETYRAVISEQMGSTLPLAYLNFAELHQNGSVDWTSWIAKDSHLLKKIDMLISFTLTPDLMGLPVEKVGKFEMEVRFNATMLFLDYNQSTAIILPLEAKNATKVPDDNDPRKSDLAADSIGNEKIPVSAPAIECGCTRDLEVKDESDPVAWYKKGEALSSLGQYNESIEAYNKALEMNSSYAAAWKGKGRSLAVLSRYEESMACFEKAIEIDGNDAEAWNDKANVFYDLEIYNESLKCFDRSISLYPKYIDAWNNKGKALYDLGKYNESIECFDKAVGIDPEYAEAWNNKGSALYDLGRFNESIGCFDQAVDIDPRYSDAWYNKGNALYKMSLFNESIESFDRVIEIDPQNAIAWSNKGGALYDLGKSNESIKAYEMALELDPQLAGAWYNKGNVLYSLGNYNESTECYDRAIGLDPNFAWAWNDKGKTLKALHRDADAEAAFSRAKQLGYQ
jgi:tetratricopeptide (TPR) repeat protein